MDRKRNYFMNDGHIVFNPLQIIGLHGIYPKTMQHSFVEYGVNTHSVESDFSLFNCKYQDTDVSFKNNFLKHGDMEFPVGNSLSKLIGGFIGSKCLEGLSANRNSPFWGKVLQQYNILTGNGQSTLGIPTMKLKENTADYIKTSVVDAAVLISHSFNMVCGEEKSLREGKMVPENIPLVQMHSNSCTEVQEHESVSPVCKQSYAEVAKSLAVSKLPSSSLPEKFRANRRRMQSLHQASLNFPQKKNNDHMSKAVKLSNNSSGRKRDKSNIPGKHCGHNMYSDKRSHKEVVPSWSDITGRFSSTTKISNGISQNHKKIPVKSREVQQHGNNRKPPAKRRASVYLLKDIEEDCENVIKESESCLRNRLNSHGYNGTAARFLNSDDSKFVGNQCRNWRCRPNKSLCDSCKRNSYFESDHSEPHLQETAVTFDIGEHKIESEICLVANSEKNADFSPETDSSVIDESVVVAESCSVVRTRISSECSVESEDSFIIMFDASVNCSDDEENSLETVSNSSDSDTDHDAETVSSDEDDVFSINSQCSNLACEDSWGNDEVDHVQEFCETETELSELGCVADKLREANALWESAYENIPAVEKQSQKVQFPESQSLATVHSMLVWDFAYRAARCGPWEQLARDRERFRIRIEQMKTVLGPVLTDHHRRHMWQKLHSQVQEIT